MSIIEKTLLTRSPEQQAPRRCSSCGQDGTLRPAVVYWVCQACGSVFKDSQLQNIEE